MADPVLNATQPDGSAQVAANLSEAAHGAGEGLHAGTEEHSAPHVESSVLGFDATGWVSWAMIAFIAILLWKKVPGVIGAALDKKIAEIRYNLDEAKKLRAEAEALRAEYDAKVKAVEAEAVSMRAHAEAEAQQILADARTHADDLTARRTRMAEDKIAAAERAAITEIRNKAAQAAATAAATLIAQGHGATEDQVLVDRTIAGIGSRLN